jgi:uncharacterized protein YwqG
LTRTGTVVDDTFPLGRTRLGGLPDVPAGFEWPRFRGVPQSFIAQIRFDEVVAFDQRKVLPSAGLLTFFYAAIDQPWGFDPADRGGWQVTFTPPGTPLVRMNPPAELEAEGRFTGVAVGLSGEVTFPPAESAAVERIVLTRSEQFAYGDAVYEIETARYGVEEFHREIHRLLGHPDPVQGDMQLECQLASNGVYAGNSTAYKHGRASELGLGATDWRLLLQVDSSDSDESIGMQWGDVGRIYYWIRSQDLAMRQFDRAWLVLQCT